MMSRNRLWRVIGLALFAIALTRIDLGETARQLVHTRPAFLVAAALSTAPLLAIRAWRLQLVLSGLGIALPFREILRLRIVSGAAGDATPGRLGEFGAAAYLRRAGYSASSAALAVLIDRGLDAAIFAVTAVAYLSGISGFGLHLSGLPLAAGTARPTSSRPILRNLQFTIHNSQFTIHNWLAAGLLSLGAFIALVFRAYCLALALDIPISFLALAGVVAISTFAQLLPISVLGIGTRDLSLLYLFHQLGLPASSAISLSWLVLAMLVLQLILGLSVWLRCPPDDLLRSQLPPVG